LWFDRTIRQAQEQCWKTHRESDCMSLADQIQTRINWTLRALGWGVAIAIIFALAYRVLFQKQVTRTVACLDRVSSAQPAMSALASVDSYAACIAKQAGNVASSPASALSPRCRYTGVWSAKRGDMVYQVTLEADGKFIAEPVEYVPANAPTITGAWSVAGNSIVWAYDSGAVWPPDINPISAESANAFTLTEVNGSTTRYGLIERLRSSACAK
jgi:hypothetical protein